MWAYWYQKSKPMTFNDLEWLFEVAYILFQGRSLVVGAAT